MKFQNPILNLLRTDKPKAKCPFNFFRVGDIKSVLRNIQVGEGTSITRLIKVKNSLIRISIKFIKI